jgi:hypothetical protein
MPKFDLWEGLSPCTTVSFELSRDREAIELLLPRSVAVRKPKLLDTCDCPSRYKVRGAGTSSHMNDLHF